MCIRDSVYQWHREGFDLPAGGELLAEGDSFSVQAFRYGTGYALQFHPEVTHAMMYRWLVRGAHRMELPGAAHQPTIHHGVGDLGVELQRIAGAITERLHGEGIDFGQQFAAGRQDEAL